MVCGTGAGILSAIQNIIGSHVLLKYSSVFQAELLAALEACPSLMNDPSLKPYTVTPTGSQVTVSKLVK